MKESYDEKSKSDAQRFDVTSVGEKRYYGKNELSSHV
jgi:hypothetical protein